MLTIILVVAIVVIELVNRAALGNGRRRCDRLRHGRRGLARNRQFRGNAKQKGNQYVGVNIVSVLIVAIGLLLKLLLLLPCLMGGGERVGGR